MVQVPSNQWDVAITRLPDWLAIVHGFHHRQQTHVLLNMAGNTVEVAGSYMTYEERRQGIGGDGQVGREKEEESRRREGKDRRRRKKDDRNRREKWRMERNSKNKSGIDTGPNQPL